MSHQVIELLLDYEKESEINETDSKDVVKKLLINGDIISRKNSIYQDFHGLLPIHLASLHELDTESMRLLIERDIRGDAAKEDKSEKIRSTEEKQIISEYESSHHFSTEESIENNIFCTTEDKLPGHLAFMHGMRALQLCILSKSEENIVLILRKENQMKNNLDARQVLAEETDDDKRTCLHLAVSQSVTRLIYFIPSHLDSFVDSQHRFN